eukprot:2860092-Rhodomonas_salina.1
MLCADDIVQVGSGGYIDRERRCEQLSGLTGLEHRFGGDTLNTQSYLLSTPLGRRGATRLAFFGEGGYDAVKKRVPSSDSECGIPEVHMLYGHERV